MVDPQIIQEKEEGLGLTGIDHLEDLSFGAITKYSLLLAIKSSTKSVLEFKLAVDTLEVMLLDELKEDYYKALVEFEKDLQTKMHGERKAYAHELTTFKLGLLIKHLKSKMPREVEIEL